MQQAQQDAAKWPKDLIRGNALGIGSGVSIYNPVAGSQTYSAANLVTR